MIRARPQLVKLELYKKSLDLVFDSEWDDAKTQNKKQYQTVVFILPIRKLFKEIDFS